MKVSTDFERPIDWLAARGLTSGLSIDLDCYGELSVELVKSLAKKYKKAKPELNHRQCLTEIVTALGFDNYQHYVDFMKARNQFKSSDEKNIEIKAKKAAKKQARYWAFVMEKKNGNRFPCPE